MRSCIETAETVDSIMSLGRHLSIMDRLDQLPCVFLALHTASARFFTSLVGQKIIDSDIITIKKCSSQACVWFSNYVRCEFFVWSPYS